MAVRGALLLLESEPTEKSRYDPETAVVYQLADWTCSAASMTWVMRSLGRTDYKEGDALAQLGPSRINSNFGLLDGTGRGLRDALQEEGEWAALINAGVDSSGHPLPLSFEQVAAVAGKMPLAMGGAAFNHWVGVRGYDGHRLLLANPAPGFKGMYQAMDAGQFKALGPFYGVKVAPA